MSYDDFLTKKTALAVPTGIQPKRMGHELFPFQHALVAWALRRGRAAIFASTGLGKTRMQLEWARQIEAHSRRPVLILAPLAVASQTVGEGERIGVNVALCREQSDVGAGLNVANYERLHKFDASAFGGVVLDESSCIKNYTSKTLALLMEAFGATPFRLCATATPAPNDWMELGTHAEFLGICQREEMLAEFFCHDGGETQVWRLKGHARGAFWRWVASWGAMLRTPDDLGYDGVAYRLPPLDVRQHTIEVPNERVFATGSLFPMESLSLTERRDARKSSLGERVAAAAKLVNASKEPWVVWCDLNAESEALIDAIPDAVEVTGSMDIEEKELRLEAFADGEARVLVSKPSICGFGLNWQHCARMAFVGLSDSWESYFQAVRRCWRFGQTRPVEVHVFASELEGAVVRNIERKASAAEEMAAELSKETAIAVKSAVLGQARLSVATDHHQPLRAPSWLYQRGE